MHGTAGRKIRSTDRKFWSTDRNFHHPDRFSCRVGCWERCRVGFVPAGLRQQEAAQGVDGVHCARRPGLREFFAAAVPIRDAE